MRARPPAAEPSFDFELIDRYVGTIVLGDAAWQDYFAAGDIEPFTIVYEDFIRDPISGVGAILDYLGAQTAGPLQAKAWQHEKQADVLSDEWTERYHELKQVEFRRLP